MRNLSVLLSLGAVFFSLHAACSADVEIERPDGGDTKDAGPSEICQAYCSDEVQSGCIDNEAACTAACEQSFEYAGQCAPAYGEIYRCAMENPALPPECALAPKCVALRADYETCVASAPCEELGSCKADPLDEDVNCDCTNDCSGTLLQAECKFEPDDTATCTCRFNGEVVGTCANAYNLCPNMLYGCCAALFAASH